MACPSSPILRSVQRRTWKEVSCVDKCIDYYFDIRNMGTILLEEGAYDALLQDRHLLESTIARVERYLHGNGEDYLDLRIGPLKLRIRGFDEAGYLYSALRNV